MAGTDGVLFMGGVVVMIGRVLIVSVMVCLGGCGPTTTSGAGVVKSAGAPVSERLKTLKADLAAKQYDLELQEAELAKHLANGEEVARRQRAGEAISVGRTYVPRKQELQDRVNQSKVEVRRIETLINLETQQ